MRSLKKFFAETKKDFVTDLVIIRWILGMSSYDIFGNLVSRFSWAYFKCILQGIFFSFLAVSNIWSLQEIRNDLEMTVRCFFSTTLMIESLIRMFSLFFYRNEWNEIYQIILDDKLENEMERKISRKHARLVRIVICSMLILYTLAVSLWFIHPSLPAFVQILGTSVSTTRGFIINYPISLFAIWVGYSQVTGFDMLFCLINIYIVSKMEICIEYVSRVGKLEMESETGKKQAELLVHCVVLHNKILKFVRMVSNIFQYVALIQMFCSITLICFTAFYIQTNSLNDAFVLLLANNFEVFMICFLGQSILDMNDDFNEALYCSEWYRIEDKALRRTIIFLLINSQREIGLSIGGFRNLSRDTYAEVLKAVWSFLAMLKNTLNH